MNDQRSNPYSSPALGQALPHWQGVQQPFAGKLQGQYSCLVKLQPALHAEALYQAYQANTETSIWTYLACGPFATQSAFNDWIYHACTLPDPLFYVICNGQYPIGMASYMRIDATNGVVEIGNLIFSKQLQRTRMATEALYLMLAHAFALGYRRVEWKCNSLNEPSKAAALRLGMTFEGVFRNAAVIKGHNRDTAWYSMIDTEWPRIQVAMERWLAPSNFDASGLQLSPLACHCC